MTKARRLRDHLSELHAELERGPEVDAATRDLLQDIAADIERVLAAGANEPAPPSSSAPAEPPPTPPPEPGSLIERLREGTWHLAETHPRLTTAVGQLMDELSRPFQ